MRNVMVEEIRTADTKPGALLSHNNGIYKGRYFERRVMDNRYLDLRSDLAYLKYAFSSSLHLPLPPSLHLPHPLQKAGLTPTLDRYSSQYHGERTTRWVSEPGRPCRHNAVSVTPFQSLL